MRKLALPLATGMLCAGTAFATEPEERLVLDLPDGFEEVTALVSGPAQITEYVPRGQTATDWHEIVTVQVFSGLTGVDPRGFLGGVAATAIRGCAEASADLVAETAEAGVPVAVAVISCPHSPGSDGPETFIAKAMAGRDAFYVVQASWRGVPATEPLERWFGVLLTAALCREVCATD